MPISEWNTIDSSDQEPSYNAMGNMKQCRNTGIYCVVSLGLLIAAIALSSPSVAETLPGGFLTVMILGVLIIIAMILLWYWQRPRR